MVQRILYLPLCLAILSLNVPATVFGALRGVVHDPEHRPLEGAMVMLRANSTAWTKSTTTGPEGQFEFQAVPIGEYTVVVSAPGFRQVSEGIVVRSGTEPALHLALAVAGTRETVNVSGAPEAAPADSATPTTLVDRGQIQNTPGASRTNSLAMITNFVPGAYITHDQLHMRGGHQTSWLIDGVPIPNTNIASNLGPELDPKDIDYLEVDRGSYGAELGDRTYGAFNVVPRTGFERNRQAELTTSFGNFYQTNDAFSIGSHSERFAYYASGNLNRSDLGIQTPVPGVVHDGENGYGGFGSLIFNPDGANQLRLVTSVRRDYYQIPYDPDPNDIENRAIQANGLKAQYPSLGLRDTDRESDVLASLSWVHTFSSRWLLTVSPFFHHNRANYDSPPGDFPTATTQHRTSDYSGGQASLNANLPRNNLHAGLYGFYQKDSQALGVTFEAASGGPRFQDLERGSGSLAAAFIDDKFQVAPWLTVSAGIRPTRFSAGLTETAISPRLGAALTVPRLRWTFRAFYGHYYQAPPLLTASGPLIQLAAAANTAFIPLHGERDEEHQFGVSIPYRGWVLDADTFRTSAHDFFDHNNLGESNLFFPVTIEHAIINGWELAVRSPQIGNRGRIHLAYSNQTADAGGAITGGLTDFSVLDFGPLDHDQRNTLNVGGEAALGWQSRASANVYYGSGFTNAFPGQPYPGAYLPGHTTFDLSVGKDFAGRFSASLNALNVANRRVELDNSVTFGGFHWNNPREIFLELRYRFRY